MHAFSATFSIEIIDGLAAVALAAAAACRARNLGSHIAGAVALGCICGMAAALAREMALHGGNGSRLILAALPDDAFVGAVAGVLAASFLRSRMVFFWLDSAGMALSGSLGAVLGLPELGLAGAIALGLACGLLPGLARDAALGDCARFVEKDWYAAALAIGCMVALLVCMLPLLPGGLALAGERLGEWAVLAGTAATLGLQAAKGDKTPD